MRRGYPTEFLSDESYVKVLRDLHTIDYSNTIVLSHYNEPMSNDIIYSNISDVRQVLPKATIALFSNGDYLNRESLQKLILSGLDVLNVLIHLAPGKRWDLKETVNRVLAMSSKLGIEAKITHIDPGFMVHATFKTERIKLLMFENNYYQIGENRGGSVSIDTQRDFRMKPCSYPFNNFTLAYDGSISPCCQIRGDVSDNRNYIIGNLRDYRNIFDAYGSIQAARWRYSLYAYSKKSGPCANCSAATLELSESEIQYREELLLSIRPDWE